MKARRNRPACAPRWTSRDSRFASTSIGALTIVAGKAAVAAAERSLANAKARLGLAEIRYRTGVGNGIELSDAQLAATNAGFQRLQATLRLDTARAQLQRALGRQ